MAGYEGMVKLVEEIDKTLYNPVWELVRGAGTVGSGGRGSIVGTHRLHGQDSHLKAARSIR